MSQEPTPRPVRRDELDRVVALMAAAEATDRTRSHVDLDDLVEQLANPMLDPGRDWLVLEDGSEIVASSALWPRAPVDGALDVYVDGVVHPRWRGRGIGTLLLRRMVERARAYVAERGAELVPVIRAETTTANAGADGLLVAEGFVPERWNFLMEADLAGEQAPAPALPAGFALSTWEDADHDELRAAHNLAFDGYHPGFTRWDAEMWQHHVSGSQALRPAVSLLLRDARGAIAAYVETSEYASTQQATGVREAFVAKVGTVPDHRRSGLASALLVRALELYRAEGYERAALDVDAENPSGALGVYERAGFGTVQRFTRYRLPPA